MRAEDIRAAVSITALIQQDGLEPNRAGYISCPFHAGDKSPSLRIYPDQNRWHCFGCSAGGTVIDWQMQMDGVGFRQAIQSLAEKFGVEGTYQSNVQTRQKTSLKRRLMQERQANLKRLNDRLRWLNIAADSHRSHIKQDFAPFSSPHPQDGAAIAYHTIQYDRIDYQRKEVLNGIDSL